MTPSCALTRGVSSDNSNRPTVARSRCPCSMLVNLARLVGLEPILLGIAVGREPEIVDHRIDIVFELGHLAARLAREMGGPQVQGFKVVLLGERALRRALGEYVEHYHVERNHRGKGNVLLFPRSTNTRRDGHVQCRERLGGLLRYYHQEAA